MFFDLFRQKAIDIVDRWVYYAFNSNRQGGGPDVRKKDGDVLSDVYVYADVYML